MLDSNIACCAAIPAVFSISMITLSYIFHPTPEAKSIEAGNAYRRPLNQSVMETKEDNQISTNYILNTMGSFY